MVPPPTAGEPRPDLCQAHWLLVSDNPEQISDTRGLFYGDAGDATCIRLLYHHQNVNPAQPLAFQVWVYDSDAVPAQLEVTIGAAGPDPDPMLVGHLATVRFWQALLSHGKTSVEIPVHQWKLLTLTVLRPRDVVSGLVQVAIRTGHLVVAAQASLPGASEIVPGSFLTRAGTHPFGMFASPLIEHQYEARLDQPRGFLLGDSHFLIDAVRGKPLKGNYGVIYHFRIECLNPSDRPIPLTLGLTALNGPAAGTFVINEVLVDVQPLRTGFRAQIARLVIPPRQRWPLDIWVSPESASAYPVRLEFLPG